MLCYNLGEVALSAGDAQVMVYPKVLFGGSWIYLRFLKMLHQSSEEAFW